MWQHIGYDYSIHNEAWPAFDESALVKDEVEIVVQLNGKIKEKLNVSTGLDKAAFEEVVLSNDSVKAHLEGKTIVKVISVPGKLINIVVK